ncbi:MAG: hypothetical protein ACRCYX_08840 [Dermatophilaceae bacterium]
MRKALTWLSAAASALALAVAAPAVVSAAPPAPVIVAPDGQNLGSSPVLQWQRVTDATRYDVAVSTNAGFTGALAFTQSTANTYATPTKDLPVGQYWWRVRSVDRAGVASTYATGTFTRTNDVAPVLTYPVNGAALDHPTDALSYQWRPVTGAKTYEIQVDDDGGFVGSAAPVSTATTSYSPAKPPAFDTPVYWRVRAKSANNVYSPWSDPARYTISWDDTTKIDLVRPASTTSVPVEEVVLEWKPVRGAAFYQLDLSPDQNFNRPIYDDLRVVGNTFTPKQNLPAGSYYWRVRPMSSSQVPEPGRWSDIHDGPWTFTRAWPANADTSPRPHGTEDKRFSQVTLLSPANGNFALQQPTFSWTPQRGAAQYEFQVGTDVNFSPGTYSSCHTDHTRLTPYRRTAPGSFTCPETDLFEPGVVRYWRVRAVDIKSDVLGAFSAARSFMYDPADIRQTAPADGATVTNPVLRWTPVENVARFRVTLSGCGRTLTATVWGTTYVPETLREVCPGPWAWTVQGVEDQGEDLTRLPNSGGWPSFTLAAQNASATAPGPVLETPLETWRPPLLEWPAVQGARTYQVLASVSGANSFAALGKPTRETASAFTGESPAGSPWSRLLPPGDYDYVVQARDATGAQISVSPIGDFAVASLDETTLTGPADCPLGSCSAVEHDTPRFTWRPVPGAGSYIVYLATDPLFTNITREYRTSYTSLTPAESLPDSQAGQATYWFVRPCYTAGWCGRFDDSVFDAARAFRKVSRPVQNLAATLPAAATPGAPGDNSVVFTWDDYLATNRLDQTEAAAPTGAAVDVEAATYQLQVSTTANFTSVLDNVTGIDQTTYVAPSASYPDGPLYARVRAHDNSANPLTWSDPITLTKSTAAPAGTTPTAGSTVTGTPLLAWTPMASAAQYDVEVYAKPDSPITPTNLVGSVRTRLTTAALANALSAGQAYGWRVRRIDANGREGGWSSLSRFTVTGPAPQLLEPSSGVTATSTSLVFSWSPLAEATRYRVDVSTSPTFGSVLESATTDAATWAPGLVAPAWPDGSLYWRVSSLDSNGAVLGTSAVRTLLREVSTRGEFTSVAPYRVLDTRTAASPLRAGQNRTVTLTGGGTGIPASGVTAVVLNATVTGPTSGSSLTVWANGATRPTGSTLNFAAGQTIANHATVPVDAAGRASLYNQTGTTHVILDVVGYYSGGTLPRGSRYTASPVPARITDTRGVGGVTSRPLAGGESRLVAVAGAGGVPASASAVVMNVTAVSPTRSGYLTVYPVGRARPTASNINFPAGATVPNLVTMPLGTGGGIQVYNSSGSTHLIIDVVGWYTPGAPSSGARFTPLPSARVADTRSTTGPALSAGVARAVQVSGRGGVPTSGASAVVLNVTVVAPSGSGYLTVFESGTGRPATSNLNYRAGQTVTGQVLARVGSDGRVMVYASTGTHVLVDVLGWMG